MVENIVYISAELDIEPFGYVEVFVNTQFIPSSQAQFAMGPEHGVEPGFHKDFHVTERLNIQFGR